MSLFRKPGEDSSSDDSSDDQTELQNEDTHDSNVEQNILSRINTIDSTDSAHVPLSSRPAVSKNNSHVRDLLLHSLLEEKALREAAEHLDKEPSHPEVKQLAQATYIALSRQLSGDEKYASDEMKAHRAAAQKGLDTVTRSHLTAIKAAEDESQSGAMVPRNTPIRTLSALNPLFSSLPAPMEIPLQDYPGLHTDRYVREFIELDVVGKGGYGKVFRVKHKLDNSFYAIKRIMVSPARLQKIQEKGPQEMENILEEVRALARFDHGNIVRYHNCWLEFTTAPSDVPLPPSPFLYTDRLLEDASVTGGDVSSIQFGVDSLSFGDPFAYAAADSSAGIVFETSDTGAGAEDSEFSNHSKNPKRRKRRGSQASQATIATVSSARSHMSTIESINGEDDDDIETIPRVYQPQYPDNSTEMSQSMMSNSDVPNQLVSTRNAGPVLTLNVQMSLYETNLAAFLSSEQHPVPSNQLHHCFHPCISLELLDNIISGVEYLHAQGVVHRDLKPANVFLSLSTSKLPPSGSINLSSCRPCPARDCLHITPRIGDFGLVAALGNECLTSNTMAKPVGTEFYRPEGGDARISEKLDVFALGVVGFEMLQNFSTRMERVDALTRLRRGEFPERFAEGIAVDGAGLKLQDLISGMVHPDEVERWSCDQVKHELRNVIEALKV